MSLTLKPKEVCSYFKTCPYNNSIGSYCKGSDPNRDSNFSCDFVTENGTFIENKFRSKYDSSGKMKIIQE